MLFLAAIGLGLFAVHVMRTRSPLLPLLILAVLAVAWAVIGWGFLTEVLHGIQR